jgi:hypothetical protein
MDALLTQKIEARLDEFIAESYPDSNNLREIVAKFRILPLSLHWGGGWAIRTDGEVVFFSYDEPHELKIEDDTRIRNMALFQGSKKYPELKEYVPERLSNAVDCPHCKGTGIPAEIREYAKESGKEHLLDTLVCYCGGLGWLPEGCHLGLN